MMKHIDVLVLGNALVDYLYEVEDNFLSDHNIIKSSMNLIDEQQAIYLESMFSNAKILGGGSAINTAIGIAKLGGKAAAIGKVNNDELGKLFIKDLEENDVDSHIIIDTKSPTGRCYVAITPDHERTMCTYLGAATGIKPSYINENVIRVSKFGYVEAYLWDSSRDAIYSFAKAAKSTNTLIGISLGAKSVAERHKDDLIDFIKEYCHIIFANKAEIEGLLGTSDIDTITPILRDMVEIAVVTFSQDGSVAITKDNIYRQAAEKVDNVVDQTGAGDLFASGFLYNYITCKNTSMDENLKAGNKIAAKVIQQIGVRL